MCLLVVPYTTNSGSPEGARSPFPLSGTQRRACPCALAGRFQLTAAPPAAAPPPAPPAPPPPPAPPRGAARCGCADCGRA
eukprot:scaffold42220_cov39-Phaeocystis_antarctica.AAC.1